MLSKPPTRLPRSGHSTQELGQRLRAALSLRGVHWPIASASSACYCRALLNALSHQDGGEWRLQFGDRADMTARNLLQCTFKGLWLFDERWAFYKAASTADTLPRPKCH